MRCFLRQFECYAAISEESGSDTWGTSQQQVCDDLSRLVRRYDKDVNGSWSFREFLSFVQPLTQYSLKAKDLSTALILDAGGPNKNKNDDDGESSTASLGELNALLKKKGKETKSGGALPAYSRATKSTAAMSNVGGESYHNNVKGLGQYSTINHHGHQSSMSNPGYFGDDSSLYNMRNVESALGHSNNDQSGVGVLSYPYMCD